MKIGIAYDLAPIDPALALEGPDDRFEEFDKPETVEAIAEVIRGEGHRVILLGDGKGFLRRVLADPPDFVFNIAEGEGVSRCREARVPAALEMLGIAYSGSDPVTLGVALDKEFARRIVANSVMIPFGHSIGPNADREHIEGCLENLEREVGYPLILKPSSEGSSKGIRTRNLVTHRDDALDVLSQLIHDYQQPVLIEEFVEGHEVTVGLIGPFDGPVEVVGTMRVVPRQPDPNFIYSIEVKRDWARLVEYETPAVVPLQEKGLLEHAAIDAFRALRCRDFARIDFRVRDGIPYFIEANPLPGLAPGTSDLVILARGHGIEYPDLIRKILHAALTRVGLL